MSATAEEAALVDGLSLEECLNHFDERLVQCQDYYREKAQREHQMQMIGSAAAYKSASGVSRDRAGGIKAS